MTDQPPTLDEARRALEAAVEAFRRAAEGAIRTAADPKALPMAIEESRHRATFALAAVGATFKVALKIARPPETS